MIIKDCIYRFIQIPNDIQLFIDTPEFQRLRNIKQLGLVHYVYPSAVHTRFEHSLGVMHLAGKVADIIKTTEREKLLLQIAGLYHDIGHIAFSHLNDYILEEQGCMFLHENRSIILLRQVNERVGVLTPREVKIVENMITGIVPKDKEKKKYLYQIVCNSSSGIDVDKMDYLQRDAYHTGMPAFQPDYIITCMKINANGELCIREKGRPEIECIYETRRKMFDLVYRHKTVLDIENLIRNGLERISLKLPVNEDEATAHNNVWVEYDDIAVEYLLRNNAIDVMEKLYSRSWERGTVPDRFKHISCISSKDITTKISHVQFC